MASADAVMALGPGEYAGIVANDVWTLMVGTSSETADLAGLWRAMLQLPAWLVIGPLGLLALLAFRRRHPHQRHHRNRRMFRRA